MAYCNFTQKRSCYGPNSLATLIYLLLSAWGSSQAFNNVTQLQRSGRNGIWEVYAGNDPENVIVKVLETQFHLFTLKNFRNCAGIMLHPVWLKQYTHDYDGIIYLGLSVERFQLRSFSLFLLLVINSSRSWELLGSEDWKVSLQIFPNILIYKSLSVL